MTKDEQDRLREVETQMAVANERISQLEFRAKNHGDRIASTEDQCRLVDIRIARVETSIEVGTANKKWAIATFLSVVMAIVAIIGLWVKMH